LIRTLKHLAIACIAPAAQADPTVDEASKMAEKAKDVPVKRDEAAQAPTER